MSNRSMKLNRFLLLVAVTKAQDDTADRRRARLLEQGYYSWGNSFYKIYNTELNYGDAKAQCDSDGTFLAIPRSEAENSYIANLVPDEDYIWLGINDIEQEGLFVAVDRLPLSWTKWATGEPNGGLAENGVEIRWWDDGRWNDVSVNELRKFVCSFYKEDFEDERLDEKLDSYDREDDSEFYEDESEYYDDVSDDQYDGEYVDGMINFNDQGLLIRNGTNSTLFPDPSVSSRIQSISEPHAGINEADSGKFDDVNENAITEDEVGDKIKAGIEEIGWEFEYDIEDEIGWNSKAEIADRVEALKAVLKAEIENKYEDGIEKKIEDEIEDEVEYNVEDEVADDVEDKVEVDIRDEIGGEIKAEIEDGVEGLKAELEAEMEDKYENGIKDEIEAEFEYENEYDVEFGMKDEIEMPDEIENDVEVEIRDEIGEEIKAEIEDGVRGLKAELEAEMEDKYEDEIEYDVEDKVEDELQEINKEETKDQIEAKTKGAEAEWDLYSHEYEDEYDEEYDDEYYNDGDEWGLGDEYNSIDNQGDPNIVEHESEEAMYKNQNEKNDTLNEEFVDMDEDDDIGFVEDYSDDMKGEWDPYDDEYEDDYEEYEDDNYDDEDEWDQYDDEYEDDNEEYEDDNFDDEDELGLGVEDNDDYFVDNLEEPSIDGQKSQNDIFKARNHYEAMYLNQNGNKDTLNEYMMAINEGFNEAGIFFRILRRETGFNFVIILLIIIILAISIQFKTIAVIDNEKKWRYWDNVKFLNTNDDQKLSKEELMNLMKKDMAENEKSTGETTSDKKSQETDKH